MTVVVYRDTWLPRQLLSHPAGLSAEELYEGLSERQKESEKEGNTFGTVRTPQPGSLGLLPLALR